jgi:sigma-B regulation protein RsbU (phosphoserine phosphatase)
MLNNITKSLTTKLVIQISSTVLIIYSIVFAYNYFESRKQISAYAEMHCREVADSTANLIISTMHDAEKAGMDSIQVLLQKMNDKALITTLIEMIVRQNQQLEGALLITGDPDRADTLSEIHFHRTPRGIKMASVDALEKDSIYLKLYETSKKSLNPFWSRPVIEPELSYPMVVFTIPILDIHDENNEFKGAFLIKVSLLNIAETISTVKVFNTGYCFIISGDGTLIAHPFVDKIGRETIFQLAKEYNNPSVANIGTQMISGETGFSVFKSIILKESSFIYYIPITEYNWSLAVLCAESDMFSGMDELSRRLIALSLGGLLILLIFVAFISGRITRPLRSLAVAARAIGKGNLDYDIPRTNIKDEVGVLTNVFSDMLESLKKYIVKLTETTSAKERIENELQIAHDVQMSILPMLDSIPKSSEFDLFALMSPAREVGGDMYDFFMTDENSLWLIIGDVSGKGIPAAFYMALTKTMLHMSSLSNSTPGEVLTTVNNEICRNNPYSMFITIFIARLNLRTGVLLYSNAGHNPPVIIHKNGGLSFMDERIGPACGMSPGIKYGTRRTRFSKEATLFMFTDGVTESINGSGCLFTDEKLNEVLLSAADLSPREIISRTMQTIEAFAKDMPQNDDITLLALKYHGMRSETSHIKNAHIYIENKPDNIDRIHAFITDFSNSCGIKESIINDLNLIIEELFINICNYAYSDGRTHHVYLSLSFDGAEITFSIEDDGIRFDPLAYIPQPYSTTIEDIKIGGQGIRLVVSLSDSISYEYKDGKNIITGKKII